MQIYRPNGPQELQDIQSSNMKNFRDIQVDEQNMLNWQGLIVPVSMKCAKIARLDY